MPQTTSIDKIQSDALAKNLVLTRIDVVIPEFSQVLIEAVKGYAGKEQQAKELLTEYHHKYRNWSFVIHEAWRYATSNLSLYRNHPLRGSVAYLLSYMMLDALRSSERPEVQSLAADHLIAYWLKIIDEMPDEVTKPVPESILSETLSLEEVTSCYQCVLRHFFRELASLPPAPFGFLMRSFYQPKKLAGKLLSLWTEDASFIELRQLLAHLLEETAHYWLEEEDPCEWLVRQLGESSCSSQDARSWHEACSLVGHDRFDELLRILKTEIEPEKSHRVAVEKMAALLSFQEVVRAYSKLPEQLRSGKGASEHMDTLMRLRIIETKGLESIHDQTLRDINFDVATWIRQEPQESLKRLIDKIFDVLATCERHPQGALQIMRTIGLELLETGDRKLIEFFIGRLVRIGFQTPRLGGVTQTWQVEVNSAHLPNIRIWLDIIKKEPGRTRRLLSALIVNLSLGGIYIKDTDLFQKDVSQLLNAPIRSVYNLVKQLAKLFPVYFNQIGAEGQLRDVSTDIDELTGRSDRLIHFLRKQSHVESNNVVVSFIEAIIEFWRTLDKSRLKDLVPPEIYAEIKTSGPAVNEVQRIMNSIFHTSGINHVKDLLDLSEAEAQELIQKVEGVSERERRRAFLLVQFYQLLHEKYALSFKDIHIHLQRAANIGLPDPSALLSVLESTDTYEKLNAILDYLLLLKGVILEPGELQILENIYYKRHIAVDIPSMYGSYNERKFDALGLTFRLENLANVLFEELIFSFNLSFITRATFFRINKFIPLFIKALSIDGITSNRLERQVELFRKALDVPRFSHSQFMDIFRGFSEAIKQIIQTNYYSIHEENLEIIIKQLGTEGLLPRYKRTLQQGEGVVESQHVISETFLRDLIARTFGLQYFDHFISSILTTLTTQKEELSVDKLDLLLSYDPEKTLSLVYKPKPQTYDLIHLGNKGHTLATLYSIGIKVPPAFVITTEYFRCRSVIESLPQSRENFQERVMEHIARLEEATGRSFGARRKALLLSVRSGAAVSMPGMMNTFLNVGINEEIVEGLIEETGQPWFGWDNYRRFIQSWGMSFGMQRDIFDEVMYNHKKRYGRLVKREFTPGEIRELALSYKAELKKHNIDFSDSPREQLFTAIRQVMESWYSQKAETYRSIMGISENWGTAVTIQAMVFGNLDTSSGAGVMFTHNPWTSEDEVDPLGDFTLGNQGEDVVGGLVKTLPLSEKQRLMEGERKEDSLEKLFPRVYQRLVNIAKELIYVQNWAPQEMEFTFQGDGEDGVYILQSRNMAPRVKRSYPVFRLSQELQQSYIGSGIGVSGGALAGVAAFDLGSIQRLRQDAPGRPIILIRSDTVPDDIREISISDGILTGKGGATSHAAIVAHRLQKTCVVGFSTMKVWEGQRKAVIDDHTIREGDLISIDGRNGAIYLGEHPTEEVVV